MYVMYYLHTTHGHSPNTNYNNYYVYIIGNVSISGRRYPIMISLSKKAKLSMRWATYHQHLQTHYEL